MIRPIEPRDDFAIARIIRTVMPEFGADGPGFAIHDTEVDAMSAAYQPPTGAYFVVEILGQVLGGAGIAALPGADPDVCELKKMYFLPELRGRGYGSMLIERCLTAARELGYARVYLETLTGMDQAQALYVHKGFAPIPKALGATGHFGCNRFYLRSV
jgi:putative acetyltransferase